MSSLRDAALSSRAWPFEEARKLLKRFEKAPPEKGYALFETGYGPSGLPHIGTFGEVARTTMVRHAFEAISDIPTKLLCFSDDMDGLRKVPTNVPNQAMLAEYLDRPLTEVPDPFSPNESFGARNNARLRAFLDHFGFAYEFASSTEYYRSGRFNKTLLRVLENHDKIVGLISPTLDTERVKSRTYSPFIPRSEDGRWRHFQVREINCKDKIIVWNTSTYWDQRQRRVQEDSKEPNYIETSILDGTCKLQWRADWAMRWAALGVDYEMFGKDLIPSADLGAKICRMLGERPPEPFQYELFLDAEGQKISKSKGNGIAIEEWLTYASAESLSLFMFQKPRTAKRLHWDVIPKTVDEYHQHLRAFPGQDLDKQLQNPVWHIHGGHPPASDMAVPFAMLLNLASVASAHDKEVLWGFIRRYAPGTSPETHPGLDAAAGHAVRYFEDHVAPERRFRSPSETEREALADLRARLAAHQGARDGEALQEIVYAVGNAHGFEPLRDWFKALYEVLLGASQGPRFGGFVAIYGVEGTIALIDKGLAGQLTA